MTLAKRLIAATVSIAIVVNTSTACGPDPCEVDILRKTLDTCSWGISLLSPENDSRQNLLLLISAYHRDGQDLAPLLTANIDSNRFLDAPEHIALPCQSNTTDNAQQLNAALQASTVSPPMRQALMDIRNKVAVGCSQIEISESEIAERCNQIAQKDGKAGTYCEYIQIAYQLYSAKPAKALDQIKSLRLKVEDPNSDKWLRETLDYLIGRVTLIAAQIEWDGYYIDPEDNKINQELVRQAREALQEYLKRYSGGRYAESARGLMRRASWMLGEQTEALNALEDGIHSALDRRDDAGLISRIYESDIIGIQAKKDRLAVDRPLLGAISYLTTVRGNKLKSSFPRQELERVYADVPYPGLKQYLLANYYFNQGDFAEVGRLLSELPDKTPALVRASLQALNANAQEKVEKWRDVRGVWRELIAEPTNAKDLRAELIRNYICAGDLKELLDNELNIITQASEEAGNYEGRVFPILSQFADEALLNSLANDSTRPQQLAQSAVETLLQKYLLERSFDKFLSTYSQHEASQAKFEPVLTAARTLNNDASDPKALINYTYFLHSTGLAQLSLEDPFLTICKKNQVRWHVPNLTPFRGYQQAYEEAQKRNDADQQAKALHFMILCFGSTNSGYACLESEDGKTHDEIANKATRKQWFQTLHSKFKNSEWAKKTPYSF